MELTKEKISKNNNNNDDDDDKRFVSQAVAFVIGHCRNGFVALCASVATLLQEQARLKHEITVLKQQIWNLKHPSLSILPNDKKISLKDIDIATIEAKSNSEKFSFSSRHKELEIKKKHNSYKRRNVEQNVFHNKIISGCLCTDCCKVTRNSTVIKSPLNIGDKVVIRGEIFGTVNYIGHLEYENLSQVYVGLFLDEAVGNSNGSYGNKVYFKVPEGYALFVPLSSILCIIK